MDALLLAAGAQLIVLERLPVPQAVSVSGHVGTILSEVFVFAPGPHISLIGKRCCDANHCHQQYQEPLFCKVFLHFLCMVVVSILSFEEGEGARPHISVSPIPLQSYIFFINRYEKHLEL